MKNKKQLFATNNVFLEFNFKNDIFDKDSIASFSISECAFLVKGGSYKNVNLYFLDMSSGSVTGTFKDWLACVTMAYCQKNGISEFVTQSSGNTANALAKYCQKFKIKANIFYLKKNKHKIKSQFYQKNKYTRTHEVSLSDAKMKMLTKEFSERNNIPLLPNLEIQTAANSIRADVVSNVASNYDIRFDWVSQSLSGAYGIFGFYEGLRRLNLSVNLGYRFLGVQQAAICPYVKKFDLTQCSNIDANNEPIIENTLFQSNPTEELFNLMEIILSEYDGRFALVSKAIYDKTSSFAIKLLNDLGIIITKDGFGDPFEKSGLINLIGVLNAIDSGAIKENESVLVAITGGCGPGPKGTLIPDETY